jgi:site-specific DNA recombinase
MNIPRHDFQRVCWNQELRMDQTDTAVWQEVCRLLEHPERLEQEYRQRLHPHHQPTEQAGLQAQMGKLRRGIARLIDSYAEGLIDKAEFEPRVIRLRERLQHLDEQLQHLMQETEIEEDLQLILGRLETFAEKVHDSLSTADFQTCRDIIRTLVKRVEVDEQQIRVVFRVSPMPFPPSSDDTSSHWQDYGRREHARRFHGDVGHLQRIQPIREGQQIGRHRGEGTRVFLDSSVRGGQ